MQIFRSNTIEPTQEELQTALPRLAQEILPFAMIAVRDPLRAEAVVQEIILLTLENSWLCHAVSQGEEFTHKEFREDIFRITWEKLRADLVRAQHTQNFTYGEDSMGFYRLELEERAALYLRMRPKFTYAEIQRIMGLESDAEAENMVNEARSRILGRELSTGAEKPRGRDQ